VNCLELLIDANADVNAKLEGLSAVYITVQKKNIRCLKLLIAAKADLTSDRWTSSPLYQAAAKGHAKCLKLLIIAGVDCNADLIKKKESETPLFAAVSQGHEDCVRLLVAAKAKVSSSSFETSPLYRAISSQSDRCLNLLIVAGADYHGNPHEITPLKHAINEQAVLCVIALLNADVQLEIPDHFGLMTALHYAAMEGNVEILQALIDKGADLNAVSIHGYTSIMLAKELDHRSCIESLRAAGADENETKIASTFKAVRQGDITTLLALLPEIDVKGLPLVDCAVTYNQPQCLAAVIEAGADSNMQAFDNMSPVYNATANNYCECLKLLINANADLEVGCKNVSPIYIAAQKGHEDSLQLLIDAKVNIESGDSAGTTPLYKAVVNGHEKCTKLLIAAGANVNIEIQGCTPVYMAASGNHAGCLQQLLAAGASSECLNYSTPPLFRAAALGNDQCVELLIKAKADLEKKYQDMTALWSASFYGNLTCVKLLLEAGADKDHLNESGLSAAWAAKAKGHKKCFRYIRDFENVATSYIQRENINVKVIPAASLRGIAQNFPRQNTPHQNVTLSTGELLGISRGQTQNYPTITAGSITIITSDIKTKNSI